MNKFITACTYLIFILLPLVFAEEKTSDIEKKYEVINVKSFLNIRSGPGTIYSILRAIPHTEKNITIVESKRLAKSTWVKIKHNNEYGWVNQVYLKMSVFPVPFKKETHEEGAEEQPLWYAMAGVYALTNIAPTQGESMDTHMLFQLESEQAKALYNAIKTPEFTDKCTGAMAKKVGEMLCLHYSFQLEQSENKTVELVKKEEESEDKTKNVDKENEAMTDSHPKTKDIYECHFSINIMQQKIQQGILCDQ